MLAALFGSIPIIRNAVSKVSDTLSDGAKTISSKLRSFGNAIVDSISEYVGNFLERIGMLILTGEFETRKERVEKAVKNIDDMSNYIQDAIEQIDQDFNDIVNLKLNVEELGLKAQLSRATQEFEELLNQERQSAEDLLAKRNKLIEQSKEVAKKILDWKSLKTYDDMIAGEAKKLASEQAKKEMEEKKRNLKIRTTLAWFFGSPAPGLLTYGWEKLKIKNEEMAKVGLKMKEAVDITLQGLVSNVKDLAEEVKHGFSKLKNQLIKLREAEKKIKEIKEDIRKFNLEVTKLNIDLSDWYKKKFEIIYDAFFDAFSDEKVKNIEDKIKMIADAMKFMTPVEQLNALKKIGDLEMDKFNLEMGALKKEQEFLQRMNESITQYAEKLLSFRELGIDAIRVNTDAGYRYLTSTSGNLNTLAPILNQLSTDSRINEMKALDIADSTKDSIDKIKDKMDLILRDNRFQIININ